MTVIYQRPRVPQWWRHLRARATGYFWLPCRRCGHMFAGYEVGHDIIPHSDGVPGHGWACCRYCQEVTP